MRVLLRFAAAVVVSTMAVVLAVPCRAEKWPPITPEETAILTPSVEPDADAEALFWEVRAEDSFSGWTLVTKVSQHVRIKIFTERGKERWSRVDLPFTNSQRIHSIAARTVLPDGRELPLRDRDVYERTVFKERGLKVRMQSFVLPGVVPGAIIEYRWQETRNRGIGLNTSFILERDIPVRRATYRLKPIQLPGGPSMHFTFHNAQMPEFQEDAEGYLHSSMTNVPAFRAETMMPPEIEVRSWLAAYYNNGERWDMDQFWRNYGRQVFGQDTAAITNTLSEEARRICVEAKTRDDTLSRLYDFCQREIRHLSDDAVVRTQQETQAAGPRNPRETLQRREGYDWDVDLLFASLAASLGYDARMARLADREGSFFSRASLLPGLLNTFNVAVLADGQWRFYDPASSSLPPARLRWQEEGQEAMIPDADRPGWVMTPRSASSFSRTRRTGVFRLGQDGSLQGTVRIEYGGHAGMSKKEDYDDLAEAGRESEVRNELRERMPSAELMSIQFLNADSQDLPLVVQYQLRIPDFAQVTGKRLFFQPAVFHKGEPAMFTEERRRHPIDFRYTWSEYDSVLIELPSGYELDHGEAPANHVIGDCGSYRIRIGLANDGRLLVYRREFEINRIRFERGLYEELRSNFDTVHERDEFQLAIRKSDASGP